MRMAAGIGAGCASAGGRSAVAALAIRNASVVASGTDGAAEPSAASVCIAGGHVEASGANAGTSGRKVAIAGGRTVARADSRPGIGGANASVVFAGRMAVDAPERFARWQSR
jgi:hypothetical protein